MSYLWQILVHTFGVLLELREQPIRIDSFDELNKMILITGYGTWTEFLEQYFLMQL